MNVTRHKIGGRAKAMVVTPSRLHAVRYVQEFKRQIKEKGLNDLEVLVAFSGEVKDNDDVFTEEGMNKDKEGKTIKEKALPETFHADDYGILVVAEKYQTGFDEPLLHTMFVDKKLSGVKAVQTLSRLNRTTRGKVDTFVLDFVNSAEDIKASFEPFYEETVLLEETDPNVVYDMKNTLDDFRVYQKSEVDKFADIFYQNENQSAGDLGKLQGQLRPAIDRYEVLEVEKQDIFKSTLASFNRVYAYITQVCRLFDKDIHRFSIYMMKLACDFNNLVYMARVRYNVMLSEDENTYANDEWSRLLPDIRHNATVDLDAVFGELQLINPRAKSFLSGIQTAFMASDIDMADELIRKRERSLKGAARAKLSRTKEFDHSKWVGGGMLDYRFSNARRIVNDIYAGEVNADV